MGVLRGPKDAKASACVYSLVETAKVNELNPYKYLEFLLSRIPGSDFKSNPGILESMLHWNPIIQKICKTN